MFEPLLEIFSIHRDAGVATDCDVNHGLIVSPRDRGTNGVRRAPVGASHAHGIRAQRADAGTRCARSCCAMLEADTSAHTLSSSRKPHCCPSAASTAKTLEPSKLSPR